MIDELDEDAVGYWHDEPWSDGPPRRICTEPLPVLPPRAEGVDAAARVFDLLTWQLLR